MATKQIHTWREATPQETTDFLVKQVIKALRDSGAFSGNPLPGGKSYDEAIKNAKSEVLLKVAELKADLTLVIDREKGQREQADTDLDARVDVLETDVAALKQGAGSGSPDPLLAGRVTALEQGAKTANEKIAQVDGKADGAATAAQEAKTEAADAKRTAEGAQNAVANAQQEATQAKNDAAQAKNDAAAASQKASEADAKAKANEQRIIRLEQNTGGSPNPQPNQPAVNTGMTLEKAEAALAALNAAYPQVAPKVAAYGSIEPRTATAPSEAAKKAFVDAVTAARTQGGSPADIRLPESALVDLMAALNKKTQGRHQTIGSTAVHCLNDYLPIEMQVDVLLPKPKLNHSFAVYDALEAIGEKDVTITAVGQFRMSKLLGKNPEIFGQDGNFAERRRPEVKRYGAQPTMILRPENVNYDFSRAIFIVDKMFQVGFEVCGYLGFNTARLGSWYTQHILDLDPNNNADDDWKGTLAPADLSKHFIPPPDKMTGASVKGRIANSSMADGSGRKWVYEGFNTTMNNAPGNPNDWSRHIELSRARSNMIDTSSFTSGGYKPEDAYARWEDGEAAPSKFPQQDGSTASTWGTWGGGWIGNWGSGGMIYQYPRASRSKHEKARFVVLDGYFRGFRSYGIEVGILTDPAGNELPRHPYNYVRMTYDAAKADEIAKYVPHNVWLKDITVEDCYEGGINANRFVNLVEEGSFVRRTGLPSWSLDHRRIEHVQSNGQPANSQVDPGYGSSSGRSSPQVGRRVKNCTYVQCPRKGIDGHHGTEIVLEDITIDAGIWCVQWVFDEPQSDIHEKSTLQNHINYIAMSRIIGRATNQGIALHNGSFGALTHKTAGAKRGNFAPNTQLWALRSDAKISDCIMVAEFPYFDNYARSATYTNCTAVRGNGFGGINPYSNKSVSCGFYLGSGNIARNGVSPNLVIRDCKAYNSPQGNFGAIARIGAVAVCRIDGLFADMTAYKKASVVASGEITADDALMLPYVGKDPALAGVSASQFVYSVKASDVQDKGKYAYDITACYKYDASTGAVTPLTSLS